MKRNIYETTTRGMFAPLLLCLLIFAFSPAAAKTPPPEVCGDILQNFPATPAPAMRTAPTFAPPVDGPVTEADMKQVIAWIANKVAVDRLPYCYKRSETRGAGVPLSRACPPGQENNAGLCYPVCERGFKGAGPVCWASCPQGFTDIGAFCQKPAAYGRGAGYALWDKDKCNNENPQGCEQNAALFYPKCRAGFQAVGSNVCSPICPSGFADTGTGCTKPSRPRGAGTTPSCGNGLEKDGALCYPACTDGMKGVGPVCFQQCSGDRPTDCAAGCSTTSGVCASVTVNQVSSTLSAAASLISMGSGSGSLVGKVADKFGEVLDAAGQAGKSEDLVATVKVLLDRAITDFSGDFAAMTTDEVNQTIDDAFTPEAAEQIKQEWARVQFQIMWSNKGTLTKMKNGLPPNVIQTMQATLKLATEIDPTGLAGAIGAFAHPICEYDVEFPAVRSGRKR